MPVEATAASADQEQQLQPEPGAELRRRSPEIDPISGTADAVRRGQQKVQLASRMDISRDSEVPPKIDRATAVTTSRRSCERKPNKCEDGAFHRDRHDTVYDASLHTDHHGTIWRFDVPPPCLGGASHGWVPVNTHGTPVLTFGVAQPHDHAHAQVTHKRQARSVSNKGAGHPA